MSNREHDAVRRKVALAVAGSLALAHGCGPAGEPPAAPRAPDVVPGSSHPFDGVATAAVRGDERLLSYRWGGHGTVPLPFDPAPARLHFGPVGRTPSTLLYLTFDGPVQREAAEQAPRWSLVEGGDPPVPVAEGRFGGALALLAGADLSLSAGDDVASEALTIELWVLPELLARGPILTVPDVLELTADAAGAVRLAVRSARPVASPPVLSPGRWTRIGVVVDPRQIRVARLVVDDAARSTDLPEAIAVPARPRVSLGGGALAFRADDLRISARAANTSELLASREARPERVERLELETTSGARSLEVWTSFLADAVIDEPAEWEAGELEHAVAGPEGLRWTEGHWRRVPALDPPLARTCHPTVYLGAGRLFVYSGEVRDSHLPPMRNVADTWFFDTRAGGWERVLTALAPPGRCHQQAAYSPDHDLVMIATGWANDGESVNFDDTWVFHVAERRWERREARGARIAPGCERALVYHPGQRRFLLFQRGSVCAYDPDEDLWTRRNVRLVDERGAPSDHDVPHSLSAAYEPRDGTVVLFGGQDGDVFHDRTLVYDPRSDRLTVLDPSDGPSARVRPGFAYDARRGRVVLFGGVRDQYSQRMDDLWSFDPSSRRWTPHEASGTPSRRGGYMHMAYEPELDRFFLVCGRHSPDRFLEEVWTLSLDERAVGRARYALDLAGHGPEREWWWEGATPGDSSLAFRFRASADGIAWGDWSDEPARAERYLLVEVTLRPGSSGERPSLRAMGLRREP